MIPESFFNSPSNCGWKYQHPRLFPSPFPTNLISPFVLSPYNAFLTMWEDLPTCLPIVSLYPRFTTYIPDILCRSIYPSTSTSAVFFRASAWQTISIWAFSLFTSFLIVISTICPDIYPNTCYKGTKQYIYESSLFYPVVAATKKVAGSEILYGVYTGYSQPYSNPTKNN